MIDILDEVDDMPIREYVKLTVSSYNQLVAEKRYSYNDYIQCELQDLIYLGKFCSGCKFCGSKEPCAKYCYKRKYWECI